jgi:YbgC/YbaW family acyl-CoA thioester hydrolase
MPGAWPFAGSWLKTSRGMTGSILPNPPAPFSFAPDPPFMVPFPRHSSGCSAMSNPGPTPENTPREGPALLKSRFTTEIQVRPDDIDMFQHVHSSRYLDYVLAARFDQMSRCYGMGMEEFLKLGLAWFQKSAHIVFKRPLRLGDFFTVTTWVDEIGSDTVTVGFDMRRRRDNKLCAEGSCAYTLVNVATGRSEVIPDWIVQKYAI